MIGAGGVGVFVGSGVSVGAAVGVGPDAIERAGAITPLEPQRADELLLTFLQHRWLGLEPILYGDQMRQACLDDWIFQGTLDVEHLPVTVPT